MGAGNFFFSRNVEASREVYVEYAELNEETFDAGTEIEWMDLIEVIQGFLPESFIKPEKPIFWKGEGVMIAYNNLVSVLIRDNDGLDATVGIVIEDDADYANLAYHHLDQYANQLFGYLGQQYELHVRTSAWTSGRYLSDAA